MSNMVVQTNVLALNAHRNMKGVGTLQEKSSQKLSSGYRINSAADDAAGLAISEKMRGQIRGLNQASKNAQDAISLIQTAEGGLQEIDNMVQRIRELVVYASNDTLDHKAMDASGGTHIEQGDRAKIQDEINSLMSEIDSMAERVEFNKKKVINGTFSSNTGNGVDHGYRASANDGQGIYFQVGANAGQGWKLFIQTMNCSGLGLSTNGPNDNYAKTLAPGSGSAHTNSAINVLAASGSALQTGATGTEKDITGQLNILDTALTRVTTERSKLGAAQNRLEYTIKSLDISSENLSAAESRVRDTDMAKEMMNLTKANVLQQSTISMLAQANQAPQSILNLLR